jgi:hypothetical protein
LTLHFVAWKAGLQKNITSTGKAFDLRWSTADDDDAVRSPTPEPDEDSTNSAVQTELEALDFQHCIYRL